MAGELHEDGSSGARLWSKDLAVAIAVNFLLLLVLHGTITTVAVYAMAQYLVSETAGGMAASLFLIGAMVARPIAGRVLDRLGRRRVLLVSAAVYGLLTIGYLLVGGSFVGLLVVRAAHGLAFGFASTAAITIAQSVIPRARHGEGTSYLALSSTLATGVGPLAALKLVGALGYDALFGAAVASAVLAFALALLLRTGAAPADEPAGRGSGWRIRPQDLLHPAVVPVGLFVLLASAAYSGVLTYLESYGVQRGLESGVSFFFLVFSLVTVVVRLVAGRVQDVRGDNPVVYAAIASFAAGMALLAAASSTPLVLLAAGLIGAGFSTLISSLLAVAVSKAPRHHLGAAVATYYFMLDLGAGSGPFLLGPVLQAWGFTVLYAALAAVVVASGLLYHAVHGREAGRPELA